MSNASDQRDFADMMKLTQISNTGSNAAHRAGDLPAMRELVGRRGSAPIEKSRATAGYLVSGKTLEPLRTRPDTAGTAGSEGPIGADDRRPVQDTDMTPWRMVCALHMRSPGGAETTATGWLAGPRTIITAGHHVFHQDFHGGWAQSIEVSAGRNRSARPFSRFTATHFAAINRWVTDCDPDFNIGCIQLDRPLGDLTGWFGLASLTASELESALVNISGYPADRGNGTEQFYHANRILKSDDRRVHFETDTYGGQSGAPVWIHRTPSAPPIVVALQDFGTGGTSFDLGMAANSAPKITPEIFDMINTWIHEDISVAA